MIAARDAGDSRLETFWGDAMDRFLDAYARELQDGGPGGLG